MWSNYKLEQNKHYQWNIGEVVFHAERREKDIRLSVLRQKGNSLYEFSGIQPIGLPDDIRWQSFLNEKATSVQFKPGLPNRPVLFKPTNDVTILPGRKGWINILIPLWVEIYMGTELTRDRLILEEPSVLLSSTWFGNPDSGILSYSLDAFAYLYPEEIVSYGFQAVCPVQIQNESDTLLKIDRLLIETEHLKLFKHKKGLFTSEIKMKYVGELNPSQIQFGRNQPSLVKDADLIVAERIVPTDNLLRRSFFFLKSGTSFN